MSLSKWSICKCLINKNRKTQIDFLRYLNVAHINSIMSWSRPRKASVVLLSFPNKEKDDNGSTSRHSGVNINTYNFVFSRSSSKYARLTCQHSPVFYSLPNGIDAFISAPSLLSLLENSPCIYALNSAMWRKFYTYIYVNT